MTYGMTGTIDKGVSMGFFEKLNGKSKKDKQGLAEQRANRRRQRTLFYRYSKVSARCTFVFNKHAIKLTLSKIDVPQKTEHHNEFDLFKLGRAARLIYGFKSHLCSPHHYRSVLSTRKHAVEGLELYVQAGSDDKAALEIADAVNEDIINHADCMDLIKNALDALGKGFSVNEIIWDTTGSRWKPETFIYRDPRWFAYDKESGVLSLRDAYGLELHPLEPYKFIVHEPNLLSGKQITSGLSFTALFYWLVKTYDVTSWAAFADRFGYPVRLGKYGRKATKEDIATLKRAVAAIGSDVGAVIPDTMAIDIIESKTTA